MATPNVRDILRVPGKLCINPTNLTAAFPHGGTALGIVHDVAIRLEQPCQYITAEEYGNQKIEGVIVTSGCSLGFILRGWDNDCLNRLFPNTFLGGVTGKRYIVDPGTIRPGERLTSRAVVLLFSPDDPNRHPMFEMFSAVPAVDETREIQMRMDEDFGIPVIFHGLRSVGDALYKFGFAHDLV